MHRGYKVWKIKLDPSSRQAHKLVSSTVPGYTWTPGENISTAEGVPLKEFGQTHAGFYSVREPEELAEQGYFPPGGLGTSGEIIPYGKLLEGEKGFRSEKAKISGIFEEEAGDPLCEVCRREPADRVFIIEKGEGSIEVCKACLKRLRSALKRGGEVGRHEMYLGLATHYDVPLILLPDKLREARRKG